jgi:hypothetical protein
MFTRYRKRTIVGITVQMFAQLNGINIISFYLPSTLSSAGFDDKKSLLYTAANAIPYTAATVATWWLADRWGRKPLLILGGVAMAVLLAIVYAFTEAAMPIMTRANGQYAFIILYSIVYGFTWGPMPWLLPAKIFPLRGRSKGMALATYVSILLLEFLSLTLDLEQVTGSSTLLLAWFCPMRSLALADTFIWSLRASVFFRPDWRTSTTLRQPDIRSRRLPLPSGIRLLRMVMRRSWILLWLGMRRCTTTRSEL